MHRITSTIHPSQSISVLYFPFLWLPVTTLIISESNDCHVCSFSEDGHSLRFLIPPPPPPPLGIGLCFSRLFIMVSTPRLLFTLTSSIRWRSLSPNPPPPPPTNPLTLVPELFFVLFFSQHLEVRPVRGSLGFLYQTSRLLSFYTTDPWLFLSTRVTSAGT